MLEQTVPLQIKFAPGDAGIISGYASVFGPPADRHGDVIAPGAFTASLASGDKPLMLWSHDLSEPIGTWTSLKEDAKGLLVTGRLTLETRRGAEAYALLKDGALNGLSIGFRTVAADELPDGGRLLKQIELAEISLVTLPSASRARVTSVKSGEITPRLLESILREAGIPKRLAASVVIHGWKGAAEGERDARSAQVKSITSTLAAATSRLTKG
ncbi:MAG: HK97 family phage prohead protease [Rhodospirillales bacterium]